MNIYLYADANSINFIDPKGLYANAAIGFGIRAIGGRAAASAGSRYLQKYLGRVLGE